MMEELDLYFDIVLCKKAYFTSSYTPPSPLSRPENVPNDKTTQPNKKAKPPNT